MRDLVSQMRDRPFERVYEAMVGFNCIVSFLVIRLMDPPFQRSGNVRSSFLTKLLDECTVDGQISNSDRESVKAAATIVYAGAHNRDPLTAGSDAKVRTHQPERIR